MIGCVSLMKLTSFSGHSVVSKGNAWTAHSVYDDAGKCSLLITCPSISIISRMCRFVACFSLIHYTPTLRAALYAGGAV